MRNPMGVTVIPVQRLTFVNLNMFRFRFNDTQPFLLDRRRARTAHHRPALLLLTQPRRMRRDFKRFPERCLQLHGPP